MSRALQVYHAAFDSEFLALPAASRRRIQDAIDEAGLDLARYPHHRLKGSAHFRLRAGDYRVVYAFDARRNELHLLAMGHRREIYR
ncbi:MAG: type II toxin-antitoxin system RelE/ParE family toxin [Opitutaceae bacterium]|nr:type II toxin-antitoxin system RelE/ParE family toxin [Opitutaceae bacterium]